MTIAISCPCILKLDGYPKDRDSYRRSKIRTTDTTYQWLRLLLLLLTVVPKVNNCAGEYYIIPPIKIIEETNIQTCLWQRMISASWMIEQVWIIVVQIGSAILATLPIVLGGIYLYEHRQKIRARRLRRALLSEINAIQPELKASMEEDDTYFQDTVFRENASKIDLLTDGEIEAVVRFYSRLAPLRQLVDEKGPEVEPDDIPDHITPNAMSTKETAVTALEENISSTVTVRKPKTDYNPAAN